MADRVFTFKITDKVRIHLDTKRNAIILFETRDGKSVPARSGLPNDQQNT